MRYKDFYDTIKNFSISDCEVLFCCYWQDESQAFYLWQILPYLKEMNASTTEESIHDRIGDFEIEDVDINLSGDRLEIYLTPDEYITEACNRYREKEGF